MRHTDEITALKAEISALKDEIAGLKEFIQAMYGMMVEEDDGSSDPFSDSVFGRFNT
ncbi:MAG: hypothetical protein LBR42_00630 [Candidatus Methanoplasma sp.]|jgi:cell division protein FtsB|nr:hypothetical protein [Candidatus Methanoplasma sp.]